MGKRLSQDYTGENGVRTMYFVLFAVKSSLQFPFETKLLAYKPSMTMGI